MNYLSIRLHFLYFFLEICEVWVREKWVFFTTSQGIFREWSGKFGSHIGCEPCHVSVDVGDHHLVNSS